MKKKVSIIGGGTAGLFLASFLDADKFDITIYDQKASAGRKFLVAGDGGFNLTHAEQMDSFKSRYTPAKFLDKVLAHFSNQDLRNHLSALGIPTFIGSSGKVFPEKGIKPIKVLKTIESHLINKGVKFEFNKRFVGWDADESILFSDGQAISSTYVIFALGGASWKVTGADGLWYNVFQNRGIKLKPFTASNCAFKVDWSSAFLEKHEGKPLKNISITIDNSTQVGEAVITKFGLEGNAIYGLSPTIQKHLSSAEETLVYIDFKPMLTLNKIIDKLQKSSLNTSRALSESLKISKAALFLLKENMTKEAFLDVQCLAQKIKQFPLIIQEAAPIDEAISTGGGLSLDAVNTDFELRQIRGQFCIGEMLAWDAPTGGYLIQACASMGFYLASHLNENYSFN